MLIKNKMRILTTTLLLMLFTQYCTKAQKKVSIKPLYIVQKDKKCGLIDSSGKVILPLTYNSIFQFQNGYYYFYEDNKMGVVDFDGSIIVKPLAAPYSEIESFSEGILRISKTLHSDDFVNGPSGYTWYGYMDKNGKIILEPKEEIRRAEDFSDALACVGKGVGEAKYGYIDSKGKQVIDYIYDQAYSFKNGYAIVRKGNEGAVIDKRENIIQSFTADNIERFSIQAGIVVFVKNKKYGVANFLSKKIINAQYDYLDICETGKNSECLILFKQSGKYGYLDVQGNVLATAQFDEVYRFDNGAALVYANKQYGMIDSNGKIIVPLIIKSKIIWGDGIGVFQKDSLYWGAVDSIGNIIIQPDKFVQLSSFIDGLAYGEYYEQDKKGIASVYCILDKSKNILYETSEYEINGNLGYGLFIIHNWNNKTKNLEYGLIDKTGKVLIPLTPNLKIENFSGPLAKATINYDSVGYIDKTGNYVWVPTK